MFIERRRLKWRELIKLCFLLYSEKWQLWQRCLVLQIILSLNFHRFLLSGLEKITNCIIIFLDKLIIFLINFDIKGSYYLIVLFRFLLNLRFNRYRCFSKWNAFFNGWFFVLYCNCHLFEIFLLISHKWNDFIIPLFRIFTSYVKWVLINNLHLRSLCKHNIDMLLYFVSV